MSRKVTGLMAAIVLAVLGTAALVAFVSSAEARALEGEELAEIYVVVQPVPSGTAAEDLGERVVLEEIPAKVRAAGAIVDLDDLGDRVAAVDLEPGEQLLDARFIDVSEFADREAGVTVPDDLIEITIALDPQRAVGGLLEPGQTVAVLGSFEPFEIDANFVEVDGEVVGLPETVSDTVKGKTPNVTDILLRKTLVTAVQEVQDRAFSAEETEEADRLTTAPEKGLLVTLAVAPRDAERLIFTAEFGGVWLAIERDTVPEVIDDPITWNDVYDRAAPIR